MDDLAFATLIELSGGLRKKQFSSVELTRLALKRLESIGRKHNAVARILHERAMKEARAADRLLKDSSRHGPLVGIPYGVKDLLAIRGVPTTYGAPPYARQVFNHDAAVIESLRGAGAVLTATLAMVELAGGGGYRYPSASLQGPGKNPWNPGHWSGGSSSGTAIAVAAGLTPFGIGSETGGSLLIPAAYCGITGLRPTYGLVSRYGAMALSWTMDKLGPMCHSAEDCGLVLEAIAGPDARDASSAGRYFRLDRKRMPRPSALNVGYAIEDFEESVPFAARAPLKRALEEIMSLGVRMKRVMLPQLPIDAMHRIILKAEGSAVFHDLIHGSRLAKLADRRQQAGLIAGLYVSAKDYLNAMRIRHLLQEEFARIFSKVDVIIAPTRAVPAPTINEPLDPEFRPVPRAGGGITLLLAGNLAGLPALSVPCGFTKTHLPLGVQLVGRPFEEGALISLGMVYQAITNWHRLVPPVPSKTASGAEL